MKKIPRYSPASLIDESFRSFVGRHKIVLIPLTVIFLWTLFVIRVSGEPVGTTFGLLGGAMLALFVIASVAVAYRRGRDASRRLGRSVELPSVTCVPFYVEEAGPLGPSTSSLTPLVFNSATIELSVTSMLVVPESLFPNPVLAPIEFLTGTPQTRAYAVAIQRWYKHPDAVEIEFYDHRFQGASRLKFKSEVETIEDWLRETMGEPASLDERVPKYNNLDAHPDYWPDPWQDRWKQKWRE